MLQEEVLSKRTDGQLLEYPCGRLSFDRRSALQNQGRVDEISRFHFFDHIFKDRSDSNESKGKFETSKRISEFHTHLVDTVSEAGANPFLLKTKKKANLFRMFFE